jgi:hypothetical protein
VINIGQKLGAQRFLGDKRLALHPGDGPRSIVLWLFTRR